MDFNFCSLLEVKKENSPYVIIVNTLLCGHCNILRGGGTGRKSNSSPYFPGIYSEQCVECNVVL